MTASRIFVLCPDYNEPSGGIRKLYRHVDVLSRHGLSAFLCHKRHGFRCNWFANDTPVTNCNSANITSQDYVVVPEIYGPDLAALVPGVPKVVFNQNSYLTFQGYSLDNRDLRTPYLHPDVFATLVVSQDNLGYLSHTFPLHRFVRIHYGIDGDLFTPLRSKRAVIAFMPRKNAAEALQVFNILKFRGLLSGFELVAIQRQSEREVAKLLGESLFFFSFGYPEGCPLPPMEAMSCGCVVVGYHGWGGREYFREEFSYPVEPGDVVTFARRAEQAILDWQKAPDSLRNKGTKAWRFIGEHYSPKREEQDIVSFWRTVLDQQS